MTLRLIAASLAATFAGIGIAAETDPLAWPPITKECRPWSYWWWMGSAVDKKNLTQELTRYHNAGWGGVHIIPIYGAKGWEDKFIPYLSPQWLEMMNHSVSEARRLGMDVDMTTGTGWPFGGPNVTPEMASSKIVLTHFSVAGGASFTGMLPPRHAVAPESVRADGDGKLAPGKGAIVELQSLVGISETGERLDLTDKVNASGQLDWTAPPGKWQLFVMSRMAPVQRVKRAAPGAEGSVLDPFSPAAMREYLARFNAAFADYHGPLPRSQYHDSYEYYEADWTPAFFDEFAARRGFDLRAQLPAFFGQGDPDIVARVKTDYRETMSELHLAFLNEWTAWAHPKGFLTRNQAHGSPGNLLDHYSAADIPETEMYSSDRSLLVCKFASSAAHVTGKRLVSSETGTWLKQHFTEPLADVKTLLDEFFVAGINHVVFHGTIYSPDEAPWPGWLFYAATQMNPRNPIWHDAPALASYIARCQSVLQSGRPDNDVLLYWPIHDLWHNPNGTLTGNSVHHRDWLEKQPVGKVAGQLWQRGFNFDYVSDAQLADAKPRSGSPEASAGGSGTVTHSAAAIEVAGGSYRAVVVPPCDHMPVPTLTKLLALAEAGAAVIFADHLPKDVPGFGDLEKRRAEFKRLLERADRGPLVGDIESALGATSVQRETMVDSGVLFTRRAFDGGHHYFLTHRGDKPFDGWLPLATAGTSAALLDPMTGRAGVGAVRQRNGGSEVFLQMQPGESLIVRLFANETVRGVAWPYREAAGESVPVGAKWQVKFLAGGPVMPPPFETDKLGSWTTQGGEAERFAGTVAYRTTFDAPAASADAWMLDLGTVAHSARVRLNGRDLGTVLMPPFRIEVEKLEPRGNVLEVEVTNLAANRIRDLDRHGVKWRTFYDINFIGIGGKPFDASNWPLDDCGLLGPVTLIPQRELKP